MRTRSIAALAALALSFSLIASTAEERTREILASFTKSKNVQKQKRGVLKSVFKEVHAEPVIAGDRTGTYAVDGLDFTLQLTMAANGSAFGSGNERARAFSLRNARIDGALLTATRVYSNGETDAFEGVFMNRVVRMGASASDAKTSRAFGIGVLLDEPISFDGGSTTRVFYERR